MFYEIAVVILFLASFVKLFFMGGTKAIVSSGSRCAGPFWTNH